MIYVCVLYIFKCIKRICLVHILLLVFICLRGSPSGIGYKLVFSSLEETIPSAINNLKVSPVIFLGSYSSDLSPIDVSMFIGVMFKKP